MTVVIIIVAVLLIGAAALTVIRLVRGPSVLDRVVATDVLLSIIVGGLAATAGYYQQSSTVPVLVALSLLGFLGSVSVARLLREEKR